MWDKYVELFLIFVLIIIRYVDKWEDRVHQRSSRDIYRRLTENDAKVCEVLEKLTDGKEIKG